MNKITKYLSLIFILSINLRAYPQLITRNKFNGYISYSQKTPQGIITCNSHEKTGAIYCFLTKKLNGSYVTKKKPEGWLFKLMRNYKKQQEQGVSNE